MVNRVDPDTPCIDFDGFVRIFQSHKCRNHRGSAFVPDFTGFRGCHWAAMKPLYVGRGNRRAEGLPRADSPPSHRKDFMQKPLAGKTVAVLVASGFEETEMTDAQKALLGLGATVKLVGPESLANGWHGDSWGHYFPVDAQIGTILSADYDMLLVPGGARSMIKLSQNPHVKRIVSGFVDDQKPVALIGQGVEVLITAERAKGISLSVVAESREALAAAGATIVEEPITLSGNVLTTDGSDQPRFVQEMITLFLGDEAVKDAA